MPPGPPTLTFTSRLLVSCMEATAAWSCARVSIMAVAAFCVTVAIDCSTGAAVSVAFLYLASCALAVWCLGETRGMALSAAGALAGAVMKHAQYRAVMPLHVIGLPTEMWNFVARLVSFVLLAVLVNGLRSVLALERWRGSHDGLTGALNKLAFTRRVAAAVERARMEGKGLVFCYMDLDGFKGVNDQFGHTAGDRVLSSFAMAVGEAIRETDLFARIGGDEFAALLVMPDMVDGAVVAEVLHRRLTAILQATGFAVTCSMGAVVMTSREVAVDDSVIEQADALMYEAKRSGKNGLRVARGNAVSSMLRGAFAPVEDDDLRHLLARIDAADRRRIRPDRRAA